MTDRDIKSGDEGGKYGGGSRIAVMRRRPCKSKRLRELYGERERERDMEKEREDQEKNSSRYSLCYRTKSNCIVPVPIQYPAFLAYRNTQN